MLKAVVAFDKNYTIGKDGHLPWHIPDDMAFFKKQTMNHVVVMGRKTWESMDNHPLPKRENVVISRQKDLNVPEGVVVTDDISSLVERAKKEEVDVIGGGNLFQSFWPYMDELRLTVIDGEFEGDATFKPDLTDFEKYDEIEGIVDEKNPYPHVFQFWRRKK